MYRKNILLLILVIFLSGTTNVHARVTTQTVTFPDGTAAQGNCTWLECTVNGVSYQRDPSTSNTDYSVIGPVNSGQNSNNNASTSVGGEVNTADSSIAGINDTTSDTTSVSTTPSTAADQSVETTGASDTTTTDPALAGVTGQNGSTATDTSTQSQADPNVDRLTDEAASNNYTDVNGFCNTAAECAAIDAQVQQNQQSSTNILNLGNSITDQDLRNGNVDMNTIPAVIVSVINVLLGVAGTISIVALIYYAVQMQINSGITGDSSGVENAKKGMRGALFGFVLAILAWFIVIRFIEILTTVSA